jgi:hypothetical protein
MKNATCLNNYCVICGRKLKDNKKGYGGNNRRFHDKCKEDKDFSIKSHNNTVDTFEKQQTIVKGYDTYKSLKDYFNFTHKALKKTPNTKEQRDIDYKIYMDGQLWLMNKRLNY